MNMTTKSLAKSVMIFALTAICASGCAKEIKVKEDFTLRVGSIEPGMSLSDVAAKLGNPRTQTKGAGFLNRILYYDGITIEFDEDNVVAKIEATGKKYCFKDWFCPGDPFSNALQKIPKDSLSTSGDSSHSIAYNNGSGCWLDIAHFNSTIASISILCQP